MSDISTEQLRKEIIAILKTADLSVVSAKKVREQIEKKMNCSLQSRKKEFDSIVMDFINQQHEGVSQDDGDDDDDDGGNGEANGENSAGSEEDAQSVEEVKKPKKRPQPTQRKTATKKKRKSVNANDSGSESDGDSDSDYEMPKKTAVKKKKAAGGTTGTTGRKSTGFTRSYNLSPELSALMGSESSPRHEVVKKVWTIIKERNLYDPKNKQYAICDDELLKVMKVKRFRTFGMLKHLKPHFLD